MQYYDHEAIANYFRFSQPLQPSDAGVYRCTAAVSSESLNTTLVNSHFETIQSKFSIYKDS